MLEGYCKVFFFAVSLALMRLDALITGLCMHGFLCHCMTNGINRMYVVRNSNKNELFSERTGSTTNQVLGSSRIPFLR
jgi:hypothetical protein